MARTDPELLEARRKARAEARREARAEARRELQATRRAAHVAKALADRPPLSDEQRETIARILYSSPKP